MIGTTYIPEITEWVITEAKAEAERIFNSPVANKKTLSNGIRSTPRTFNEVYANTLVGKCGEQILKTHYGYVDDPAKWHDLISKMGIRTEVKTWNSEYVNQERVNNQIRLLKGRSRNWFQSTELVVICYNKKKNIMVIQGIYDI